jgi:hypothetical protein
MTISRALSPALRRGRSKVTAKMCSPNAGSMKARSSSVTGAEARTQYSEAERPEPSIARRRRSAMVTAGTPESRMTASDGATSEKEAGCGCSIAMVIETARSSSASGRAGHYWLWPVAGLPAPAHGLGRNVGGFGIERIGRAVAGDEEFGWLRHIAARHLSGIVDLLHQKLDPGIRAALLDRQSLFLRI